jgi:hypothetical protein
VVVFLGDLGRDLPYRERLHWKQFNVDPAGGISEVNFRRSFVAQFTDPKAPDLIFRAEYSLFAKHWSATQSWPLFLPLEKADEHLLQTVRIPVTNSQSEFDDQVLALAKLLVDSLNEKAKKFPETDSVISFLRDLQELRSSGSGHRKGTRYQEVLSRLGIAPERKPDVMSRLLQEATAMLKALRDHFLETAA